MIYQLMQMLNSTLMEKERIHKFEPIPKNRTRIGWCLAERMPIPRSDCGESDASCCRKEDMPSSRAGHCAPSPKNGKEWFKNLPIHLIASWISLWSWSLQWLWRTASELWSSLGLKLWQVNYIIDFLLKNVGDLYNLLCLYILTVLFHGLIDIGDCWRHSFLILLPLRPIILGSESVYMGNLRMGVLPQCTFFISSPCHAYPMGTEIFC